MFAFVPSTSLFLSCPTYATSAFTLKLHINQTAIHNSRFLQLVAYAVNHNPSLKIERSMCRFMSMDVCRLGLVMTVALVTRTKLLYTLKSNPAVTEMRWVTGHGCTASVCNEPLRPTQPPTLSGQEMSACQGAVAAMRHGSTHGLKAYKEGRLAPRLHSLRNMAPFTFFTCIVSKALKIDSSASSRFQ